MLALVLSLVRQFVIPEIVDIIKRKADANGGKIPTVQEIQQEWAANLSAGISKGEDWLARHPE